MIKRKRTLYFKICLCVLLVMQCILPYMAAWSDSDINDSDINKPSVLFPQSVRVLLSWEGSQGRATVIVDGAYTVENGQGVSMRFPRGAQLEIAAQTGNIMLSYLGMVMNAGNSMELTRYRASWEGENGLRFTVGGSLYEGNLRIVAQEDTMRAVLTIGLEDYLLGVVPYEMSESFPLEALKAQAITARTYAAGKINDKREYDLTDNTNDQVFRGKSRAYTKTATAVFETKGIIGWYENKPAQCFYTASNGGQTERISHVWGGADVPYLDLKDDLYDITNPASVVKRFHLATLSPQLNEQVITMMLDQLEPILIRNDLVVCSDLIRIDKVENVALSKPKYSDDSKVLTMLSMDILISGKKQINNIDEKDKNTESDEEIVLFNVDSANHDVIDEIMDLPHETPYTGAYEGLESGEDSLRYSDFIALTEIIPISLPLFPLDKALGISINNSDNEIITLEQTETGYILLARRYGHGVGMSQRGAEYMAGNAGMSWDEILSFYYPGVEWKEHFGDSPVLPILNPEHLPAPEPKPTPTPRPTLMPVTQPLPEGARYARVTEIADDSWLNMREEPNVSSEVRMRLYKNQPLIVLRQCLEEGFVQVKTDTAEGFVMEMFLTYDNP